MGTGPFAVPSFEALRAGGYEIALVVTKPTPPVKSRKGPPPNPVRQWADDHGLPVFDPASINEPDAIENAIQQHADLMVVCDYGHILKPAALAAARLGGINLHGSLLPAYRGAAPVQRALLSGDKVTGVSVIHMTPRLDGGPILATAETAIRDDETAGELEERLSDIGVTSTIQAVEMLVNWDGESNIGEQQNPDLVTKAPRLSKAEGMVDWTQSYTEISCHVRGMQPWPIAFTHLQLDTVKQPIRLAIKKIACADIDPGSSQPGEVVAGDGFFVAVADGVVQIMRLQPAGKREMDAIEFLRGHKIPAGTPLGLTD